MKWEAEWWGTTIIAESEADNDLIDKLTKALPEEAVDYYEKGEIKTETTCDGMKKLIFNR